ncbi:REP-associated tyrosine transposase [Lutispora sp.]|uniref:REP-associated tyrosine transposase n=1 Tax=Lutispora sp. TaxID=2828727 RepID=UPI002B1F21B4|nr:transposase [Lutispora sp.]MEA4961018.1 transposase [Lutispora sp.]
MPRDARNRSESGIYHIMLRGINRQNVFEDEQDIERLLETIKKYKEVSKCEIYAYCIMTNHFHMLVKEVDESISDTIKRISSSYVFWYNKKYERCGHLFQERFKSETVENDEYFLIVLRYIHQNPMKAGIVKDIAQYKWSSYREYIGKPNIISPDFALDMFSPNRKSSIELFCSFNNQKNSDMCLEDDKKARVSDVELKQLLFKLGVIDSKELKNQDKNKRNEIVRKLKEVNGVTVRQLSRITGLSKSQIGRI